MANNCKHFNINTTISKQNKNSKHQRNKLKKKVFDGQRRIRESITVLSPSIQLQLPLIISIRKGRLPANGAKNIFRLVDSVLGNFLVWLSRENQAQKQDSSTRVSAQNALGWRRLRSSVSRMSVALQYLCDVIAL